MKAKVFIGSSTEDHSIASAISAQLQSSLEPTVWSQGIFGLSQPTVSSLMQQVAESDFAIIVFGSSDTVNQRGEVIRAPRDNVVYELGLFTGAITPKRCFIIAPDERGIHIPTDLLGMAYGKFDPTRRDGNLRAAVGPFCDEVLQITKRLGFRPAAAHAKLRDMATMFDCCEWIVDTLDRVQRKQDIFEDMVRLCRSNPINKTVLMAEHKTSSYFALSAAIVAFPEEGDFELLMTAETNLFMRGESQMKAVQAMIRLKDAHLLNATEISDLARFARNFRNPDPALSNQINALTS